MSAHTTTDTLQSAVCAMDRMAQEAFSEIAAVAKLVLVSLENPSSCNDLNTIAYALEAIHSKAQDAENNINARAEEVGCNYVDEAHSRRWAAKRQTHEAEGCKK